MYTVDVSACLKHWSTHALRRYCERYGQEGVSWQDFASIVPRIEARFRPAFDRGLEPGYKHPLALIKIKVPVEVRAPTDVKRGVFRFVKIWVLYNFKKCLVVTVYPPFPNLSSRSINKRILTVPGNYLAWLHHHKGDAARYGDTLVSG